MLWYLNELMEETTDFFHTPSLDHTQNWSKFQDKNKKNSTQLQTVQYQHVKELDFTRKLQHHICSSFLLYHIVGDPEKHCQFQEHSFAKHERGELLITSKLSGQQQG